MREISTSEAIVVAKLLAGSDSGFGTYSGVRLPRRTRQTIRQRLLARECLFERYVPNPVALGRPKVVITILHPYTDRHVAAADAVGNLASCSNLWSFRNSLFGVFFLANDGELEKIQTGLAGSGDFHDSFYLLCDAAEPSIPVYFDFEMAWARITGLRGTTKYPHGLPIGHARATLAVSSSASTHRARELLTLAPNAGDAERGSEHVQVGRWNREIKALLRRGVLEFRTFLNPIAYSGWATNFPGEMALVRGQLRSGRMPPELFVALVSEGQVSPFLFAVSGRTVVFAALAKGDTKPHPMPGPSLLGTIEPFLEHVIVVRESFSGAATPVLHRYDTPFTDTSHANGN